MNARCPLSIVLGLIAVALTSEATAQTGSRIPSVVQLPSFRFFSYSGTVVVPDSGGGFLGGNKSYASGARRRGFNRAQGSSLGNPQVSVFPTIIDNNEIDRQLLSGSPEEFLKSNRGRAGDSDRKTMDPTEEGKALVRFARTQYREGNKAASFDTYRMAIQVLQGRLRELATVEFRRVFGPAADQSLRMASARR
jgi:hypothetical protein